jgi:4'-phosphopantetheinyl transferase EntD
MLAGLLPASVAVAESVGIRAGPRTTNFPAEGAVNRTAGPGGALFPAEEAVIRTAGPGRRAEFVAGRRCARAALAALGLPAVAILPGRAGQPLWPDGVTGSITHCAGYLACAAARVTDVAAIGIDAEPDAGLPPGLVESLAGRAELAWIASQAADAPVCWDRLLFSAKEAVSKLWYPLTGQWLGFSQVAVFPAPEGTFAVRLRGLRDRAAIQDGAMQDGAIRDGAIRDGAIRDGAIRDGVIQDGAIQDGAIQGPAVMQGRWRARGGLIVTAVSWSPEDGPGED